MEKAVKVVVIISLIALGIAFVIDGIISIIRNNDCTDHVCIAGSFMGGVFSMTIGILFWKIKKLNKLLD